MFEQTEPPAGWTPSPRLALTGFGLVFVACVVAGIVAWFRWSTPLSTTRMIATGEFIVGGVLSGVFLLTARNTSPKTNGKRLFALFLSIWLPQLIIDVFFR